MYASEMEIVFSFCEPGYRTKNFCKILRHANQKNNNVTKDMGKTLSFWGGETPAVWGRLYEARIALSTG